MRIRTGWTARGIVGLVFAPIGLLFVLIALAAQYFTSSVWKRPDDFTLFTAVFSGVGSLFLLLGLGFLWTDIRRRRLLQRAYDAGNCVDAMITGVSSQSNVSVNGRHPCVVECAYTDAAGVVHIYRSRYLYTDVTDLLTSKTVPVYIDRFDENIGYVDIDAVLPEIRVHS